MLRTATYIICLTALVLLRPPALPAETPLVAQPARKTVDLTGYTRSRARMTVSSEAGGRAFRVNYDVGDVIADAPFAEIDPTFVDLDLERVRQNIRKTELAIERNRSRVAYLTREFNRIDALYKKDVETESRRDALLEELRQARFETQSLDLDRAALNIELKTLRERKARHGVFAPKGWRVTARTAEEGELIAQGAPLARAADFQTLVVPLSLSPDELAAVRNLPEPFAARLEDRPARATIRWVNPKFDEQTRKLAVELTVTLPESDGGGIRPRGGLRFSLSVEMPAEGLMIPEAALTSRYENPRVTSKETGETVNVVVLGRSGDHVIVADDGRLTPGAILAPAAP